MWRIDLAWNINHGIWFSPMVVRDLDGDGKAEVCLRTAPYAATREHMFSPEKPFVLDGPEYLAVYAGDTGREIDKVDWIERGQPEDWADRSGNRSSRHVMGVAYLDGRTPSVLAVRGTYGLMKVDAWMLQKGKLQKVWRWTNERAPFMYQGQGQHSIKTADIDGDGADEILNGSIAIDNDGRTMWGTGLGHGDRFYVTDIDPSRPGLEVWYTIEDPHPRHGVSLWDALRGTLIFGSTEPNNDNQIAGGLVGDIDPQRPGMEVWGDRYFFSARGERIDGPVPPQNEAVWWDGDLLRELHSRRSISKWKGSEIGRTEGSVLQVADIAGDWREEIVTFSVGELRVYGTSLPARDRRVTPDAGSPLSQRRDPSLDGISARADDQLFPGRGRSRGLCVGETCGPLKEPRASHLSSRCRHPRRDCRDRGRGRRADAQDSVDRPNVIVVFADDFGDGDLGSDGHPTIRTPHLDRMAAA